MPTWEEVFYRVAGAQGMVSAQAECSLGDALVLMCERAQVEHRTLSQVATAVLDRAIRFGDQGCVRRERRNPA